MNRATLTYGVFAAVLVGGLWLVLTLGKGLEAAPDLNGAWRAAGADAPAVLTIAQSGTFLHIAEGGGAERQYRLDASDPTRLTFRSGEGDLIVERTADPGRIVLLRGAERVELERGPPAAGAAGHGSTGKPAAKPDPHPLLTLFLQLLVILGVSRLVGLMFVRFGQPQVMGEMVAGILLGPSLFGLLAPGVAAWVFPPDSIRYLNILSQIGVTFFLFLIGLELDPRLIRNRGHAAVVISHASIIAPFLLGAVLTLFLYPRLFNDTHTMRFTAVTLFMGAAMSITAFPVLARILTERNLHKSKVGAVAITCAAVDDVTAWCMLAVVIGVARAEGLWPGIYTAAWSTVYVLVMFFGVRPLLRRLEAYADAEGRLSQTVVAVIVILVVASAYVTEWIGIHALFGAFLMGAIMPKGTRFVRNLSEKLEDYTVVFLLPVFFAFTGLKTQIGLIDNAELWLTCLLIIAVACAGKFGGSAAAALACGLGARESGAIGILMNTRGLMELVILNIGRELGVITDAVFAMMVIMALVTTFLTTPVLNLIYPDRLLRRERAITGPAAPGTRTVLIPVALPKSGRPLLRLADMLSGPAKAERRIAALYLRRPVDHEAYRSGLDEEDIDPRKLEALQPLLEEAHHRGVEVETITHVSRDVPGDIARAAQETHADLVLMGFHKPVLGGAMLGGTVHHVLNDAGTDVGVLFDRGLHDVKRVLVPYLGSGHDRLALELADGLARDHGVEVTVLHVVPPRAGEQRAALGAKEATEKTFNEPGHEAPVKFKVVESATPVDVAINEAPRHDLVILGVSLEWGLDHSTFGWRPERIARDCPTSLLMVRKGAAVGARSTTKPDATTTPLPLTPPHPA